MILLKHFGVKHLVLLVGRMENKTLLKAKPLIHKKVVLWYYWHTRVSTQSARFCFLCFPRVFPVRQQIFSKPLLKMSPCFMPVTDVFYQIEKREMFKKEPIITSSFKFGNLIPG